MARQVLEVFLVETSSFVTLIEFFKTKEKQEDYKGLARMRFGIIKKSASTRQVPFNARPLRSTTSDVYSKRNKGRLRYSNC